MQYYLRKIGAYIYKPYVRRRIAKPSQFKYRDITLSVPPGVFHPKYFHSSLLLAEFIRRMELQGKTLLELGCGSGLLSCAAAGLKARVTASDINPLAVTTASENAKANALDIETIQSDLFEKLQPRRFDYICINPPYYPKDPMTDADSAWYCGAHFEYFEKLFFQLPEYIRSGSAVFIVLSDQCAMEAIRAIAAKYALQFNSLKKQRYWNGAEEIFSLSLSQ